MTLLAENPAVSTVFRFKVLCTGKRKDGRICNEVLARTTLETWERQMHAGVIQFKCPRCGTIAVFK